MKSESGVATLRRWAETGLKALPFVAVALFIFQYSYATTFLEQFGVSPDQVGVNQVQLATRAALFGVVILAVYGLAVAVVALLVTAVMERPSPAAGANAERRQKQLQVSFIVVAASCAALATVLLNPSWILVGVVVVFTAVLIYWMLTDSWRRRPGVLVWALLLLSIVSLASYFGGVRDGNHTAETGNIPGLLGIFGVDILQVRPTWIEPSAKPVSFPSDQDVLVLGTATGSVFVYDCHTNVTRRVAASQVALDYSLQDAEQPVARLKCRR